MVKLTRTHHMTRTGQLKKNVITIDFSKPKGYKTKDWLTMEAMEQQFLGKITRWRSAQGGAWTTSKNGRLYIGDSEVIENDKGIWGSDFSTLDGKHYATLTFVNAMHRTMKPFNIRKRSKISRSYR